MYDHLKVGDQLTLARGGEIISIHSIEKVTKTGIFTGSCKYSPVDLCPLPRSNHRWSAYHVRPTTEQDLINLRIQNAQRSLGRIVVDIENIGIIESLISASLKGK